jgi:AraC family transcriptional regulator
VKEHFRDPLWRDFGPRTKEIVHTAPASVAYGVIDNFDEADGEFDYVAGLEVDSTTDIPEGMTAVELPDQTYAVFECTLPTLMDTNRYVHQEWLPASGYVRAEGPEFELYDERFDMTQGKLDMAIYIPVRK